MLQIDIFFLAAERPYFSVLFKIDTPICQRFILNSKIMNSYLIHEKTLKVIYKAELWKINAHAIFVFFWNVRKIRYTSYCTIFAKIMGEWLATPLFV